MTRGGHTAGWVQPDPKVPPALVLSLGTHFDPPSLPAAPAGALSQPPRGENWAEGATVGPPSGWEQGSSTGSP